ncbi:MAG: hypothetical protein A2622_12955 [Bdellovibrionales bacterium RIFCSPHIGHO2_01_FULL_40_29]|nr:MAG: hypothetical protein A2622_12955 [Bdellovibrionales bacterium RIFCSPHIGHO2_01_FULL_40_29]OFZ33397.1 MAG: hypothetical protein A3D17_13930 [Bdellovibrionales bacterium RIFCSPHIGHO2_02_FULL_40_15]
MKTIMYLITILTLVSFQNSYAAPKVGKRAAARYFQGEVASNESDVANQKVASSIEPLSPEDHFLTFGFSNYVSSDSYKWGQNGKEENVGKWGLDMMYRIGQYNNLIDQGIRVSYNEFEAVSKKASKLSFMYAITLPDAGSQFPLYFGMAAGPGVFMTQLEDESSLSLDYQLYLGLRLFNVFEKTGFYVEGGLKNHLQLTSDGQLNGTYVSAGAVFTF